MNPQRLVRLAWVFVVNTAAIWFFVKSISDSPFATLPDAVLWLIGAGAILLASVGVIAEFRQSGNAKRINIATPLAVSAWLVLNFAVTLSEKTNCGLEIVALIFGLVPVCVAGITAVLYWILDADPNANWNTTRLRL